MKIKRLVFLLLPSLLCSTAFATKMCPPEPPCFDPDHKFNSDKCTQTSDWVAVGKIEDVIDDKIGDPLNKNFAKFKFKVIRWEKAPSEDSEEKIIEFKIGWCENWQELPSDTSGLFRFYGQNKSKQYKDRIFFYFEKISNKK